MGLGFFDQASGLRRLFGHQIQAAIELIPAGRRAEQLLYLALERLAQQGRRVLFLDEQSRGGQVYGDLRASVLGDHAFEQVVGEPLDGVMAVGVAGIAHSWLYLDVAQRARLLDQLHMLERRCDLWVVRSAPEDSHARVFNRYAHRRLLVAEPSRLGVEMACAELAVDIPSQEVFVTVARARSREEAGEFFHALEELARRRWQRRLIWLGEVERDPLEDVCAPLQPQPGCVSFLQRLTDGVNLADAGLRAFH